MAMLMIYAMGNVADSTANNSAIIIRAVGAEKYALFSFFFAYYVIGLPGAYTTSCVFNVGYQGVWYSLVTAYWLMLILMGVRIFTLDWKKSVEEIHKKHVNEVN